MDRKKIPDFPVAKISSYDKNRPKIKLSSRHTMHFSTNDGQHSKVFAKIPFQSDFLNCSMRGENDLSFQRISKYGRILVRPNLTKNHASQF